jgi:FkbM family methyltransferase
MIDPLAEHEQEVAHGEFIVTAVGAEQGTVTIELGAQSLEHSTVAGLRGPAGEGREVPITTLDALMAERGWEPPFGLKVDVEGYEDQVILGAAEVLSHTQFVIAEVQMGPRFRHSYSVAELLDLLGGHGFFLHDILDGHKSDEDGGLHFIDGLFVRRPRRRR